MALWSVDGFSFSVGETDEVSKKVTLRGAIAFMIGDLVRFFKHVAGAKMTVYSATQQQAVKALCLMEQCSKQALLDISLQTKSPCLYPLIPNILYIKCQVKETHAIMTTLLQAHAHLCGGSLYILWYGYEGPLGQPFE